MMDWWRGTPVESDPGQVNFVRWTLLKTPWLTVCLHKFVGPDRFDPHSHDYDSVSLILKGWYIEGYYAPHRPYVRWSATTPASQQHVRKRWRPWFRPAEVFHHIGLPSGMAGKVWTLFVKIRRLDRPAPGYLVRGRFVPLAEYDQSRGWRSLTHPRAAAPGDPAAGL